MVNLASADEIFFPSKEKTPKRLIVFVHGVTGGSRETWENASTKFFWPEALSKNEAFKDADILSFGYTSRCRNDFTVSEVSRDLADTIKQKAVSRRYKSISFIAHSLGGIIVRDLVAYRRINNIKVSHIITLATPSLGSSLANYAHFICNSSQIEDLKEGKNSTIDKLNDFWRDQFEQQTRSLSFVFVAAYEIIPMFHASIVVDKDSAVAFSQSIKAIDRDHMEIAKPRDDTDAVFRWANMWLNPQEGHVGNKGDNSAQTVKMAQDYFEKMRAKLNEQEYNTFSKKYQSGIIPANLPTEEKNRIREFQTIFQK